MIKLIKMKFINNNNKQEIKINALIVAMEKEINKVITMTI